MSWKNQLKKILNKIPRPSPEESNGLGKLESDDATRYLNLIDYKIYTQYKQEELKIDSQYLIS